MKPVFTVKKQKKNRENKMQKIKFKKITVNRETGEEKASWIPCGILFEKNEGFRIKLDSIPVSFDGWLYVFKETDEKPLQNEEDIPF